MKTASKIYAGIASSLLLVASACTNDLADEPKAPTTGGDSKLKLELTLDGTRAYTDKTSFTEGDEILVIAYNLDKGERASSKATYTSGKWVLETDIDLNTLEMTEGNDVRIFAYYPYSAVAPYTHERTWASISLPDVLTQIDYIGGEYDDVTLNNPVAKIPMNHAMARISLNISNPFDEDINVSGITLSCYAEGDLNYDWVYQAGIFHCSPNYSYIISEEETISDPYTIKEEAVIKSGDSKSIDILVPGTARAYSNWNSSGDSSYDTGVKFDLLINGKTYSFKVPHPYFMEGNKYTYNVTLKEKPTPTYEKTGIIDGHEYVDLGLSVLWATCNIGASAPEEYGDYFAWGETKTKEMYTTENYAFNGLITDELIMNGQLDPQTLSLTSNYDAASQNWGGGWRMPTKEECEELVNNCIFEWNSGIRKVIGPNGGYIHFPATGQYGTSLIDPGFSCDYWSSTSDSYDIYNFKLYSYVLSLSHYDRYNTDRHEVLVGESNRGLTIRAVRSK